MRSTQHNIILRAMLNNKWKKVWTAKDFQRPPFFIGYEASARMSELMKMYPEILIVGKRDRFRTLSVNWDNVTREFINSL